MTATTIEPLERRMHLAAQQAYDWRNAVIKGNGFIDGIVFSPVQPNLVFAHTDMGGAYRWDQAIGKWIPLNDFSPWNDWPLQNLGVETMAVDPTDANRVYMSAGTYFSPAAILRSTDAGHTWLRSDVSGIHPNGNGNGRNGGERMIVDPNLPGTIYYGTRRDGLWKSSNFGVTWNRLTSFPVTGDASGTAQDVGIEWVVVDRSSAAPGSASQTIYAGVSTSAANKIYVSTNGGATWSPMAGQPTSSAWFPIRAALTPDGGTLYMTYSNNVGPNGATSGSVYKVTNPSSPSPAWTTLPTPALTGGGGWSGIDIDPRNPNRLVISTLDHWAGPDDVFLSTNGGLSWGKMWINLNRDDSPAPYARSQTPHWLGDVKIDPFNPAHAIVTTGYGLYSTFDLTNADAAQTVHWSFSNEGLEQSAVLELASPNQGAVHLFSAIGDRDGFRHDNFDVSPAVGRLGQNTNMAKGTNDDIDVAFNDSNYLVRLTRSAPYVQYSRDNGITWLNVSSSAPGSTSGGGNLAISADGTRIVYEPGGTTTARYSVRSGTTWSAFNAPSSGSPANNAKIVADLSAPQTFYAYSGTTLSRTTDGGANWTVMTSSAPNSANWLRAVPGVNGHLFMSRTGSGLWRSTNGGATWSQVSAGIVTTALSVGIGAAAPGAIYPAIYVSGTVGGTTGFFRSDDQGATWTTISDAQHQYGYITVIQADPRVYGRLYVGANGRSVLYGGIATALPPGWTSNDIGAPNQPGVANVTGNLWTLEGAGTGMCGTSDQFQFASTSQAGDLIVTASVRGVQNTSASAKAGVMIRNSFSADAAFVSVMQQPDGQVQVLWRASAGAPVQSSGLAGGNATGRWLRLARIGSSFQACYSDNGVTWTLIGSPVNVSMNFGVRAGLAVSSQSAADLCAAGFSSVSVARGLRASKTLPILNVLPSRFAGSRLGLTDTKDDESLHSMLDLI